ncbi:hypothetical protein LEQ41_05200 [Streptococcus agalactiae]|nr:hypothetical protein [Streptococcus agalactiae]
MDVGSTPTGSISFYHNLLYILKTLLLQGFYFVSLLIHCPYLRKKILGTDSNIELGHLISSLFVNIRE